MKYKWRLRYMLFGCNHVIEAIITQSDLPALTTAKGSIPVQSECMKCGQKCTVYVERRMTIDELAEIRATYSDD